MNQQQIDEDRLDLRCRMIIDQVTINGGTYADPGLAENIARNCRRLLAERRQMQERIKWLEGERQAGMDARKEPRDSSHDVTNYLNPDGQVVAGAPDFEGDDHDCRQAQAR